MLSSIRSLPAPDRHCRRLRSSASGVAAPSPPARSSANLPAPPGQARTSHKAAAAILVPAAKLRQFAVHFHAGNSSSTSRSKALRPKTSVSTSMAAGAGSGTRAPSVVAAAASASPSAFRLISAWQTRPPGCAGLLQSSYVVQPRSCDRHPMIEKYRRGSHAIDNGAVNAVDPQPNQVLAEWRLVDNKAQRARGQR